MNIKFVGSESGASQGVEDDLLTVARRERPVTLRVSLRGSLAAHFHALKERGENRQADRYLRSLIYATPADVCCFVEGEMIVVGRPEEVGNYWPDW